MIIEHKNVLKSTLSRMSSSNKTNTHNEISRLGSVDQRSTEYRRNGMLNFGAKQMIAISGDFDFYVVGVGGPPVVG
jgi:hypothetical protein